MKAPYSPAWIGSLVAAAVLAASTATAQDRDLSAARELYASAAYEDALVALNRLRSTDHPPSQSPIIEQYRAFCLLALGRASDAEQAIEAVVTADPSFHPADSEVSPRIRTTFTEVRRRMLPVIIQHAGIGALIEGRLRRWEPYLYGALAALAYLEAGPDSAFIYFQF